MILPFLALFCVGLRVGQGDVKRDESFPRPSISAWPSSVVPANGNVTLRCLAPIKKVKFALRRGRIIVESPPFPDALESLADFHLTNLENSNSGEYTCEYYRTKSPLTRSPPSDTLLLLVTGNLPKPSLKAHQRGKVTTGETVTLQCQKPAHIIESHMFFALLKEGTSTPIQLYHPEKETDFSLQRVTVNDTGNYSCVYYQQRAPFWASEPSDHLTIWVTVRDATGVDGEAMKSGMVSVTSEELEKPDCGPSHTLLLTDKMEPPKNADTILGTTEIILIVTFTLLLLLAAFLIYRYACCGAALNKTTKSSLSSKKPEEVVTDASPDIKSCPTTLDEGPQVSRAEDPHGVTYAELNTRALSEGPSSQVKQPLEICVYSALKT